MLDKFQFGFKLMWIDNTVFQYKQLKTKIFVTQCLELLKFLQVLL